MSAFDLVEHAGPQDGPVVALVGGVHGDEEEGVLAVQRVSAALAERPLVRGRVRAVAIAHPAAYAAAQRTGPDDGLDLARSFPGDPGGRPTERLAHELTERVIRGSDLLIDLHSAGVANAMPTFVGWVAAGDTASERARSVAERFGIPLLWEHRPPVPPGRTVSAAHALGVASVYAEGSGGGSLERDEVELFVAGVLGTLCDLGMAAFDPPRRDPPRAIVRDGAGDLDAGLRAPVAGRFVAHRAAGDAVAEGDRIGEVVDAGGAMAAAIDAPAAGTLMFVRRRARIAAGEVVCALGGPIEPWTGTW